MKHHATLLRRAATCAAIAVAGSIAVSSAAGASSGTPPVQVNVPGCPLIIAVPVVGIGTQPGTPDAGITCSPLGGGTGWGGGLKIPNIVLPGILSFQ